MESQLPSIELRALAQLLADNNISVEFSETEYQVSRLKCNNLYELELTNGEVTIGEIVTFTNYGHDLTMTTVDFSVPLSDPQCLDKILYYFNHKDTPAFLRRGASTKYTVDSNEG